MSIELVSFLRSLRAERGVLIPGKLVKQLASGKIEAYSSGFESGKISPLAIRIMNPGAIAAAGDGAHFSGDPQWPFEPPL